MVVVATFFWFPTHWLPLLWMAWCFELLWSVEGLLLRTLWVPKAVRVLMTPVSNAVEVRYLETLRWSVSLRRFETCNRGASTFRAIFELCFYLALRRALVVLYDLYRDALTFWLQTNVLERRILTFRMKTLTPMIEVRSIQCVDKDRGTATIALEDGNNSLFTCLSLNASLLAVCVVVDRSCSISKYSALYTKCTMLKARVLLEVMIG